MWVVRSSLLHLLLINTPVWCLQEWGWKAGWGEMQQLKGLPAWALHACLELPLPIHVPSLSRPNRFPHRISGSNSPFQLFLQQALADLLNTGSL